MCLLQNKKLGINKISTCHQRFPNHTSSHILPHILSHPLTSARPALHLYGTPQLINEYKLKQYRARPSAGMRHGGRSNPTPAPSISSLRAHRLLALLTHSRPAPSLFTSGYMLCAREAQRRSRALKAATWCPSGSGRSHAPTRGLRGWPTRPETGPCGSRPQRTPSGRWWCASQSRP